MSRRARRCARLNRWLSALPTDAASTSSGLKRMNLPIASEAPSTVIRRRRAPASGMTRSRSRRLDCIALTISTKLPSATSGSHAWANTPSNSAHRPSAMASALSWPNRARALSRSCRPALMRSMELGLNIDDSIRFHYIRSCPSEWGMSREGVIGRR